VSDEIQSSTRQFLSQKDFAEARGWSKQYVNQLVKKGRIRLVDGLIDEQEANLALGRTKDPSRSPEFRTDGIEALNRTSGGSEFEAPGRVLGAFAKARTVREHYRAHRERLEYELAAGNLVSRQEVEIEQFTTARMTRDRILQGMNELAAKLSVEHHMDRAALSTMLVQYAIEMLNDIANNMHEAEDEIHPKADTRQMLSEPSQ